jgi:hypothetical protein
MICMACDGRNVAARGPVPVLYMFRTRATIQHCKRKRIISTLGTAELLAEPQLGTSSVALRNNRPSPPVCRNLKVHGRRSLCAPKRRSETEACETGSRQSPCAAPFSFLPSPRSRPRRRTAMALAHRLEVFEAAALLGELVEAGGAHAGFPAVQQVARVWPLGGDHRFAKMEAPPCRQARARTPRAASSL